MTEDLSVLFDQLLPDALETFLRPLIGRTVPRLDAGDRYRVRGTGRFRGAYTADLLRLAHGQKLDGALVLVDDDVSRVLYFRRGEVVGADSNVLFERVGRVLLNAEVIDKADAYSLVDCEEKVGVHAAVRLVPEDVARWGIEKRTWEVGAALYFMGRGHYLCVDGPPDLGDVPQLSIDPMQLAMEGMRRYDEWRNGSGSAAPVAEVRPPPAHVTLDREAIDAVTAKGPETAVADEAARLRAEEIMRELGAGKGPRLFGLGEEPK